APSITLTPREGLVVSASPGELRIWPAEPRQMAAVLQTGQEWGSCALSPDGKWLVTLGATMNVQDYSEATSVMVWDMASRRLKFHLVHKNKQPTSAVFSPNGRFFALGGEDHKRLVEIWDTTDWDAATSPLPTSTNLAAEFEVGSICFSPD